MPNVHLPVLLLRPSGGSYHLDAALLEALAAAALDKTETIENRAKAIRRMDWLMDVDAYTKQDDKTLVALYVAQDTRQRRQPPPTWCTGCGCADATDIDGLCNNCAQTTEELAESEREGRPWR